MSLCFCPYLLRCVFSSLTARSFAKHCQHPKLYFQELLLRLRMKAEFVFCFTLLPQRRNKDVNAEVAFFNRTLPRAVKRTHDQNIVVLNGDVRFFYIFFLHVTLNLQGYTRKKLVLVRLDKKPIVCCSLFFSTSSSTARSSQRKGYWRRTATTRRGERARQPWLGSWRARWARPSALGSRNLQKGSHDQRFSSANFVVRKATGVDLANLFLNKNAGGFFIFFFMLQRETFFTEWGLVVV